MCAHVLLLALAALAAPTEALRALMVVPFAAHSHNTMFKGVGNALVDGGHEVVVFSPFPRSAPRDNYTDVDTRAGDKETLIGAVNFGMLELVPFKVPVLTSALLPFLAVEFVAAMSGDDNCRRVFGMPELRKALAGGYGRFDVVLTEAFGSDCWAVIPHLLGVPNVAMTSGPEWPWVHDRMGSVDNPSYLVNLFMNITEPMSFMDRVENTVFTAAINYAFRRKLQDGSDAVVREFFGDGIPPLRELVKNTSVLLLNRHHSVNPSRPFPPNVVPVGGIHVAPPPNTLDPELRAFMDGAEHGVVYFSLGSMMHAATMPAETRDSFLWAFSRLKQRVVWKYEADDLRLPDNVRVAKWLPQMDVLTHPKTRLFITHGGLMGTLEALHCAVPMLGIPLFADQWTNMDTYERLGAALTLERFTMTKEAILAAIRDTLQPRFAERARAVAARFADRPREAAAEAVWWVEYVVRHGGAPHLRPRGVHLPWWQYHLLDVLAFLAALAAALAAAALATLSCLVNRFAGRRKRKIA